MTPKKAHRYLDANPLFAAKECAERYPVTERIDTIEVQNDEMLNAYESQFEYLYKLIDSLTGGKLSPERKDSIITIIRYKTKPVISYKTIVKTVRDSAAVAACRMEAARVQKELNDKLDTANKNLIRFVDKADKYKLQRTWLFLFLLLLLAWTFRKFIKL